MPFVRKWWRIASPVSQLSYSPRGLVTWTVLSTPWSTPCSIPNSGKLSVSWSEFRNFNSAMKKQKESANCFICVARHRLSYFFKSKCCMQKKKYEIIGSSPIDPYFHKILYKVLELELKINFREGLELIYNSFQSYFISSKRVKIN